MRLDDDAAHGRGVEVGVDLHRRGARAARERHRVAKVRRRRHRTEPGHRACGLAGFRPTVVAETMDFAVQLELVRIGVGVALVPHLTVAGLPPEVLLAKPRQRIDRHIFAARRSTMHADPGLDVVVRAFRGAATARLRIETPESS